MSKLYYRSLIVASCVSKEESERFMIKELKYDVALLEDSTRSILRRIDGTEISVVDLEDKVKSLMDKAEVTGLALSVINDNQIVYRNAFGYADHIYMDRIQRSHKCCLNLISEFEVKRNLVHWLLRIQMKMMTFY